MLKLNILHITEALGGGVLNIVQMLSNAQVRDGHNVMLMHSMRELDTPDDKALNTLFSDKIQRIVYPMVTSISPLRDFQSLVKIISLIQKTRPDIIHLHSSKAGVLGRIACKFTGYSKNCFYTPHGYSFLRQDISVKKRNLFKKIEQYVGAFGGTTLACSASELHHAKHTAKQSNALVVENAVPVSSIAQAQGSNLGLGCIITTSGRICYQKNPSAFRGLALSLQHTPAQFVWLGGGELERELYQYEQLPKNIKITGWLTRGEVTDYLQQTDIFIMTSLWEGMPLSLLEAQVAGLVAVVPDVEGCRDVVIDGVTGFICKDAASMVEKTLLLIENTDLRRKMGQAARELSLQRFSPERMHQETMDAYLGKHLSK